MKGAYEFVGCRQDVGKKEQRIGKKEGLEVEGTHDPWGAGRG